MAYTQNAPNLFVFSLNNAILTRVTYTRCDLFFKEYGKDEIQFSREGQINTALWNMEYSRNHRLYCLFSQILSKYYQFFIFVFHFNVLTRFKSNYFTT